MDPINVDFSGNGKSKTVAAAPPGSTAKKIVISLVIAAVVGAVAYYFMLPALNPKAIELYIYIAIIIIAFIAAFGLVSKAYFRPEYMEYAKNKVKIPAIMLLVLAVVVGIGFLTGATIFRAKAYHEIIDVKEGNFATDVAEADFASVPRFDETTSNVLAYRALGDLSDYVSQFSISPKSTQINYKGSPVRVHTLQYGDVFKWFKNTKEGIPAYIIVDMLSEKTELVRDSPIKYSPAEHFNEYLIRHVRFKYPTLLLGEPSFEIDDNAKPYWIVPVLDKTIGLFGGTDVMGAVLVDASTGETELVCTGSAENTKLKTDKSFEDAEYQWVDHVYSATILNEQYNYYGKYINGFINSIIGQSDVRVASQGSNYLALNDDVYMYTGVTSISSDQSIIGFVLINQRTKEANYYPVAGALENTAQTSAQGKVQQYGYQATFPLLLNVNGEPTYFMALKDSSELVKMYAMVNVRQSTVVVAENDLAPCIESYVAELDKNGIKVNVNVDNLEPGKDDNTPQTVEISGTVAEIRSVITGGETYFYIRLTDNASYYKVAVSQAEKIVILNVGDTVTFNVDKDAGGDIIAVKSVK